MAKLAPIFSNLSEKLIKQFGRKVTLKTVIKGHYDPMTGESKTIATKDIMVLQGTYSSQDFRYQLMQGKGSVTENQQIQLGDIPIYSYEVLDKNDRIIINNVEYAIIRINEYVAEDKTVLYEAVIRGNK